MTSAGEKNGNAKLTKEQVLLIREMYAWSEDNKKGGKPFTQQWIARCFKVGTTTIARLLRNETWKSV